MPRDKKTATQATPGPGSGNGPGPGRGRGMMGGARPKDAGKTLGRLLAYTSAHKSLFVFVVLGIVISALTQIAGTALMRNIIDDAIAPMVGASTPEGLANLARLLLVMGGIYLLGAFCIWGYNRLMLKITSETLYKIRMELFTRLESLPIRYYDTNAHGDIMSRFTNDVDAVRNMLSNSVAQFISSAITVVGVFVMMLIFSWQLTLLVLLVLLVMLFAISKIGGLSGRYFKAQQDALGKVNGYIEEYIEGQKVVKVFSHEETAKAEFHELSAALCDNATRANVLANVLMPIMMNLTHVLYALTAGVGGAMAFAGILTLGTVVSFLQYTRTFAQPVTQIAQQFNNVLSALAGAERIFNLLDEAPEVDDGYVTLVNAKRDENGELTETAERTGMWAWRHPHQQDGTITYTELKGHIEFENVTFSYEPGKEVLKNISLYAKPGQKIAFVGSTGAGKTTITNLINRFYDVPDGKIRYDGININKIKKADLRRSLGMVLQDTHLFTGTVRENIRYGKLDASDEDVITAAKLANADSFINMLPEGYDTMLTGDGANLSQGQRQLLAIARAAAADPPVLILDEATSSIDTRTEKLIEQGMDRLMEGRTVFVIAHRLSTVRNARAIIVLENGEIIERGDHDDLIEQRGKYYQLYTGMFELS